MGFIDIFLLSIRSFKTRPMRSLLTVLGMGVGIGAVLFLVSFGYGMQQVILNRITSADALLSLDVSAGTSGLINLDKKSLQEISEIPEVVEVSPVANFPGQLSHSEITGDMAIYSVDKSFFRLSGINASQGRLFSDDNPYEVVVSSITSRLFGYENPQDILGQEVKLSLFISKITEDEIEEVELVERQEPYKVVGVISDEAANYAYVLNSTLVDLDINNYDQAKVKVVSSVMMESVRDQIIEKGFLVSALSDIIEQAEKIFRIIQIVLGLFGLIALVVSAIGMFNTMTITLLERTNEIGIMRSIGVTRRDVQSLFLSEAMIIGFLGGLSGVLIGILGGELVNIIIGVLARNFGGQSFDLFYTPSIFIIFIIVFSTIIGFLTGIYPARRAGKLNPLDALRYK